MEVFPSSLHSKSLSRPLQPQPIHYKYGHSTSKKQARRVIVVSYYNSSMHSETPRHWRTMMRASVKSFAQPDLTHWISTTTTISLHVSLKRHFFPCISLYLVAHCVGECGLGRDPYLNPLHVTPVGTCMAGYIYQIRDLTTYIFHKWLIFKFQSLLHKNPNYHPSKRANLIFQVNIIVPILQVSLVFHPQTIFLPL